MYVCVCVCDKMYTPIMKRKEKIEVKEMLSSHVSPLLPLQLHQYSLAETFCCDGKANQTYG